MKIEITGIRCNNLNCDFVDEKVSYEEYHLWLNKLCPKCNNILLTKSDFDFASSLLNLNDLYVNKK